MIFFSRIGKYLEKFESSQIPYIYFPLTFFFATSIRNFLEVFVYDPTTLTSEYFFHYYLFYISLALSLIIFFHLVTREDLKKISKVVLPSFSITILPPLIDLMGGDFRVSYILPGHHGNLIFRFLNLGGSFANFGVSTGIKIELGFVLILCFIYFMAKRVSLIKSLISIFLLYTLFFTYGILPYVAKAFLNFLGMEYSYSVFLMTDINLFCILILLSILFLIKNKTSLREILKDIPIFRLTHFELMFILGIFLSGRSIFEVILTPKNIFDFSFIIVSIFFAGLFSLILNNIEDRNIDRSSNRKNSPFDGILSKKNKWIIFSLFFLSIIYSITVSFKAMFIIVLGMGTYFIYSCPPLRLKRVPVLSKLIISFNSLIAAMLGFIFSGGKLVNFPPTVTLFFLVFYTLAINFIDIKDYREDKEQGIMTLPVFFGLRTGKIIIGTFFLLAYLVAPLALSLPEIFPISLIFGITSFVLIVKKKYRENYVFATYLSSILILLLIL